MAVWSEVPQWHKVFYHDAEVMGSNRSQVKQSKSELNQKYLVGLWSTLSKR